MRETFDIEARYLFAQRSYVEFARTLSTDDWSTSMPCTPEWTVRDALSHVAGIPDDAIAGRMDGAPGEAWTAAQIERNRSLPADELLDRWDAQTPEFARVIQQMDQWPPPFDCHTHEHDVRQALGRPGDRRSPIIEALALDLVELADCPVSLTVELSDGRTVHSGPTESAPVVTLSGISAFDAFRSRPGRRRRDQVRSWHWTGNDEDIDAVVDRWFIFGPATISIIE